MWAYYVFTILPRCSYSYNDIETIVNIYKLILYTLALHCATQYNLKLNLEGEALKDATSFISYANMVPV